MTQDGWRDGGMQEDGAPAQLRRSLTWDQGARDGPTRSTQGHRWTTDLLLRCTKPWRRGSDENTHGLLR